MNITVITDQQVLQWADYPALITAMEAVFLACAQHAIDNFQFVRSHLRGGNRLFSIKSGCNYTTGELGLKCGGYWEDNQGKGLDRHQSTVLLIDGETGRPRALLAGNNLTALRTAAAAAAAARCLARKDSTHVALLGAGRQALFQLKALCEIRSIRSVSAWSRSSERVQMLGEEVRALGLSFIAAKTPRDATRDADIIVTITPSTKPLIKLADVAPGTHINAMGSDTHGKRELAADLLEASRIWADDVAQAGVIGECQHLMSLDRVACIGDLLLQREKFQRPEGGITIFDGTGIALQDLAAASLVLSNATRCGCVQTISI